MCPYIKFQSIWRTLDFAKICPKLYESQNFEKLNMKIVTNIYQCNSVSNFKLFGELQVLGFPNLSKKYK